MKPRMRERPIQAWGSRLVVGIVVGGADFGRGEEEGWVSRMDISPGAVGVRGGSFEDEVSVEGSLGRTGPGMEVYGFGSTSSRLERRGLGS